MCSILMSGVIWVEFVHTVTVLQCSSFLQHPKYMKGADGSLYILLGVRASGRVQWELMEMRRELNGISVDGLHELSGPNELFPCCTNLL